MKVELLVKLTSKAWALKILSLMHEGVAGRQAPLLAATNATRSSFAASLEHLANLGLLERNPGHGHPLRPEFRLTQAGKTLAPMASRIISLAPEGEDFSLVKRSWAVPILAVTATPTRFGSIKSDLGSVTDRALSQSLGLLEDHEWMQREIDISERTPFPTYKAVNTGQAISRIVAMG